MSFRSVKKVGGASAEIFKAPQDPGYTDRRDRSGTASHNVKLKIFTQNPLFNQIVVSRRASILLYLMQ